MVVGHSALSSVALHHERVTQIHRLPRLVVEVVWRAKEEGRGCTSTDMTRVNLTFSVCGMPSEAGIQ